MQFQMVLLAISYKYKKLCVAGIRLDNNNYVRLTHYGDPIEIHEMIVGNRLLKVLDVIQVDADLLCPNGCQIENYNLTSNVCYIRTFSLVELDNLYNQLRHSSFVYLNNGKFVASNKKDDLSFSLELFKVMNFHTTMVERIDCNNCFSYNKPYGSFTYNNIKYNELVITDCVCVGHPSNYGNGREFNFEEGYILVSLPYDKWAIEHGFYKYIAGIIY